MGELLIYSNLINQVDEIIKGDGIKNCGKVNDALILLYQAVTRSIGRPLQGGGVKKTADILSQHRPFCSNPNSHHPLIKKFK